MALKLAQEVRAEGHRQPGLAHDRKRGHAAFADGLDLGDGFRTESERLAFKRERFIHDEGRHRHRSGRGGAAGASGLIRLQCSSE